MLAIPCTAVGSNSISLSPQTNCPTPSAYTELCGFRFVAAANSTGPVQVNANGLGLLNVYKADGVTQCGTGDLIGGEQYVVTYHGSLNSGLGGFYLESPSVSAIAATTWYPPGGRATLQSATPVMVSSQLAQQTIFYAPYNSPFIPLYNGSSVLLTQFTSSLSDQVGLSLAMSGAANFPSGAVFDLFVTLSGGTPILVATQWTNTTTRATTLSVFGGFLTNSGSMTAQTGPSTSMTVPQNQGTFVGSFICSAQGQSQFKYGSGASGGGAAYFGLCNYYNKVLFNTFVEDTGATYTYTSGTTRQARNSTGNQIQFIQSDSERSMLFQVNTEQLTTATVSHMGVGIGFNSTTLFVPGGVELLYNMGTSTVNIAPYIPVWISTTGFATIARLEFGDGTNAWTLDNGGFDSLTGALWL